MPKLLKESEVKEMRFEMVEIIGLIAFAGIFCVFLIVIPTLIEKFSNEEFKKSYIKHLSKTYVHSYGK